MVRTFGGAGIKRLLSLVTSIRFQVVFFLTLFIVIGALVFRYVASTQSKATLESERTEKLRDIASTLPNDFESKLDAVINQYLRISGDNPSSKSLIDYLSVRLPSPIDAFVKEKLGAYKSSAFGFLDIDSQKSSVIALGNNYKNSWYPRLISLSLVFPSDTKWTDEMLPGIKPYITIEPVKQGDKTITVAKTNSDAWKPPLAIAMSAQSFEQIDSDLAKIEQSIGNSVLLTLAVGISLAILLGISITSRLVRLKKGISNLSIDLSNPVPVVGGELGEIAIATNTLAQDLIKSKSRSEKVLDSVSTAIVVIDSNLRIIQSNPSALVFSKNQKTLIGSDISSLGEVGEAVEQEIVNTITKGSVWNSGSIKVKTHDATRFVNVRIIPVKLGGSSEAVVAIQDVTESVVNTLESEREASLARLGLFTMGVAHEVRNPLTSIKGFVQLLERKLAGRDEERFLKPVMREVERLEVMITELLESSRPGPIQKKPADLAKVVEQIVASQAIKLNECGIKIVKNLNAGIVAELDEKRFHQVILNLILNSKDAMPDGGVLTLSTYTNADCDTIEIKDTGMGISDEDAAKIFTPFYTTKASGTGLGLSICDQIVKSHGGTISFKSDENGTAFYIKLPKGQTMEERNDN